MNYLYHLANASLTLRIVEFLHQATHLPLQFMTVVHQIDGWIIRIHLGYELDEHTHRDLLAFLNEQGIPYEPSVRMQMAFWSLETGLSPVSVMQRYQVAVVSHGQPDRQEIETFRQHFVQGLGYCPETLA
jgi:hypothetical protein